MQVHETQNTRTVAPTHEFELASSFHLVYLYSIKVDIWFDEFPDS